MGLVKRVDVVIENFSPEAAESFGITYENLKQVRTDIIFAHISAFGPDGPYSHRLGFDQIAKAMSGSMSLSGFPGNPPVREVVNHIDYGTGMLTALGIVSALYRRDKTGVGRDDRHRPPADCGYFYGKFDRKNGRGAEHSVHNRETEAGGVDR